MKSFAVALAAIAALSLYARAESTRNEQIRPNCFAQIESFTDDQGRDTLNIHVSEPGNKFGNGFFNELRRQGSGLYLPTRGFNVCDPPYQPTDVSLFAASNNEGKYEKIVMDCGGILAPVSGHAELTLDLTTKEVIGARVELSGAYGSGVWHTGPLKEKLEDLSCDGDALAAIVPLFPAAPVLKVRLDRLVP